MKVLVAIVLAFMTTTALAESAGDAVKAFGLIGTWSPDCANVGETGNLMLRIIFKVPTTGDAVRETMTKRGDLKTATIANIEQVLHEADDKLRITFKWTKQIKSDGTVLPKAPIGDTFDMIAQKAGSKIVLTSVKTNEPMTLERCVDADSKKEPPRPAVPN